MTKNLLWAGLEGPPSLPGVDMGLGIKRLYVKGGVRCSYLLIQALSEVITVFWVQMPRKIEFEWIELKVIELYRVLKVWLGTNKVDGTWMTIELLLMANNGGLYILPYWIFVCLCKCSTTSYMYIHIWKWQKCTSVRVWVSPMIHKEFGNYQQSYFGKPKIEPSAIALLFLWDINYMAELLINLSKWKQSQDAGQPWWDWYLMEKIGASAWSQPTSLYLFFLKGVPPCNLCQSDVLGI